MLRRHVVSLPCAGGLLLLVGLLSLRYGVLDIDISTVWESIWSYDRSDQGQVVVRELRVPRTIIGILAGAGFAVAGALTQGVTRNPLGAPGILGTNAGAAFAVVTAIYSAGITTPAGYVWFAFAGALGATVLVYLVASAGSSGPTPVKLALAGAVISALLGSWTAALLLLDLETLDQARFWLAGSISGRGTEEVQLLLPVIAVALVVALSMGRRHWPRPANRVGEGNRRAVRGCAGRFRGGHGRTGGVRGVGRPPYRPLGGRPRLPVDHPVLGHSRSVHAVGRRCRRTGDPHP